MDKLVCKTILSFFLEKKEVFLKDFDDCLLKELKNIKCNKFAVINNFNDVIIEKHNECYEKLLLGYKSNCFLSSEIDSHILSTKILNLIKQFFENDEEYKKIIPTIKELTKELSKKLQILYDISVEHLSTNERKIS